MKGTFKGFWTQIGSRVGLLRPTTYPKRNSTGQGVFAQEALPEFLGSNSISNDRPETNVALSQYQSVNSRSWLASHRLMVSLRKSPNGFLLCYPWLMDFPGVAYLAYRILRAVPAEQLMNCDTTKERLLLRILALTLSMLESCCTRAVTAQGSFGKPRLKSEIQPNPKPMITTDPITNEQEIDGIFRPLTAGGNPAPIDGDVQWEVLDGNATLGTTVDPQGGQVQTFRSEDAPAVGISHFRGTADADLGQGFTPIVLDYELQVIAPGATSAGGSFSAPRIKT